MLTILHLLEMYNLILKDIKLFNKKKNTILLSPASASYDQFLNNKDDQYYDLYDLLE